MSILNEYATYTKEPRINSILANAITGYSFKYPIKLVDGSNKSVDMTIIVSMNQDDLTSESTDNCIYSYLNSNNINYTLIPNDPTLKINNLIDITKDSSFTQIHPKAWKSTKLLYLSKVNLNTGVIRLYNPSEDKFSSQEYNWNSATPEESIRGCLTESYLEDYFKSELSTLTTNLDFYIK